MYIVDPTLCPQDHACPLIKYCPVDAISQTGHQLPTMNPQLCIRCGKCEANCPKHAVKYHPDHDTL